MIKNSFHLPRQYLPQSYAEFVRKDIVNTAGMADEFAIVSPATSSEELGEGIP